MKILYIGSERSDAQAVATALRGLDHEVTVSWASRLEHAAKWLDENRDFAAMVVEAQTDGSVPSVLEHVRGLPMRPAVVVIVPEGAAPLFESLHPQVDDYIVKNHSLFRDLPSVVTRAVARARGYQQFPQALRGVAEERLELTSQSRQDNRGGFAPAASAEHQEHQEQLDGLLDLERVARADLEQKLAHATAALQDAERRHRAALAAADAQLAERHAQYEIGMARAATTWEMVDEQLRAAAIDAERARQNQASAEADVDRLSRRELDLTSQLAEAAATRSALERQLRDAETAVEAANARTEHARLAAAEQLEGRQREFQVQIAQEVDKRRSVEERLALAIGELDDAEKRHGSAIADLATQSGELEAALRVARRDLESQAVEVERLTKCETDLSSMLADVTTSRHDLERRLAATEAAFEDAATRATRERLAASKKAAEREAELDGQIRRERAAGAALEQRMADAAAAARDAQERHDAALAAAATELAERQAHFDRELSQTVADRDRLSQQLGDAEVTLDQARRAHQSAAADAERLTEREADLTSQLADVQAGRHTLERQLADAAGALRQSAEREAELDGQIRDERTTRAALEQALADAEAAARDAQERHDAALAAAATELAQRQAHFDGELSQTAADRDRLTQQLSDAEVTLDQVRRAHQSTVADVERLTEREADLTSQLADVQAARHTLERQLADAAAAIGNADARAARETAAAAERQADLEAQLAQEIAARTTLEQTLTETRSAALDAGRAFQQEADALRARGLEQEAHFEVRLAQERLGHASRLAEMQESNRALTLERDALQESTATITAELREAERILEDARARFQWRLDVLSTEHGTALAGLAASVSERDAQLQEQAASHAVSLEAAERARAELEKNVAAELDARHREIEQLQETLTAAVVDLELAKRRQEALQTEASLVPRLHEQLEESRAESHRLFEQAGLAMFRCTPDGALTHANRACTTLVGRRTIDELRAVDFAAAVFEAPNVLSWLIERCLGTRAKESIETTWRRDDGGRLFVRLSARLSTADVIEIVVEDLTRLRVLQERLDQAHRMEAVGRLAREVAVTCSNLLTDIHQKGRTWLMTASGDADSRQQGERLLEEVKRAAGFLQQLAACGDEQTRTPMPVDLNTLIRDLEPVLRRVAGGDVEVQLRDTWSPLIVDVETERVERLLVNVASYGRQRMPSGGRLRIELGTTVVDRRFAAKHPNVRLGLHALITVTEFKHAARADGPQLRDGTTTDSSQRRVAHKPGVDFGTLQGLVSECGGHLWMKIQPLGDMVARIRLPLSSPPQQTLPRTGATRGGRERPTARWFHT